MSFKTMFESKVGRVILSLIATATVLSCKPQSRASLENQLEDVFVSASRKGKFNGSALVVRQDKVLCEYSYGLADQEKSITNRSDTRFLVASVNKPLTAVLVLQLVEAGKLNVTNSLAQFFPTLSNSAAGKITVHQLLTHTSGLEEIISNHRDRRITPQDLESAKVKSKPDFEYSSTGFVCLALLIEAVTGQAYEDVLTQKILAPAGMTNSGLAKTGKPVEGLALGYHRRNGKLEPAAFDFDFAAVEGAGSLYTTTGDLWKFNQALDSEKILSRKMQTLMTAGQVKDRAGYGWFLKEQGGRFFPLHKGDFAGHAAVLTRQTQRQEVIVILSNLQETDVLGLNNELLKVLKANP